jgi:hypothetical protein
MIYLGNGVVWNPSRNERLCKFEDGKLETTNQSIIDLLNSLGYKGFEDQDTAEENKIIEQVKQSRKKR